MKRERKVKIIATLGPASKSELQIQALIQAGVNLFRLNFSHGKAEDHLETLKMIRKLEEKFGKPIGVIMDLQGPKLRVGTFETGEINLNVGQHFMLDQDKTTGTNKRVYLPHPEIFSALKKGQDLLLDDGKICLVVENVTKQAIETKVAVGGVLKDRKGVNVPSGALKVSALTAQDKVHLKQGLEVGVDWVFLSFVQRPEDVIEAKEIIKGRAMVASKIEKPAAIECLDAIINESDGILIARGDLGVEMSPEDVPIIQKRIIRNCRRKGCMVAVATQMLESMISSPRPTRAEASDVANAVYEGADAVMLSAETAAGKYPEEAVNVMVRIIKRVEADSQYRTVMNANQLHHEATSSDAISAAASTVAETVGAVAIVTYTTTGSTTLRAARERPGVPIVAIVPDQNIARALTYAWGVTTFCSDLGDDAQSIVRKACEIIRKKGLGKKGDQIVITAGVPFGQPGSTNALRVATL